MFLAHDVRPPFAPCPVVTLVHDVAFERHPEFFSPYERAWMTRGFRYSCRHSAGVIAVSNFTRDEIVALYGVPTERITVAPNGVEASLRRPDATSLPAGVPRSSWPWGRCSPARISSRLIRAYRSLRARRPELGERLAIAGAPGHGADAIRDEAADLRRDGALVFTGYVGGDDLLGLIQHATAFAYPSVYEGFGLPPLEAMAAGTPTLASDIPVTREVLGDAAELLPPRDDAAWSAALERLVDQPELRGRLSAAGRERAATFTWERSAERALEALERAARWRAGGPAPGA